MDIKVADAHTNFLMKNEPLFKRICDMCKTGNDYGDLDETDSYRSVIRIW